VDGAGLAALELFQIDPVGFRGRVAFSISSPRNHERRGVSGRRTRYPLQENAKSL